MPQKQHNTTLTDAEGQGHEYTTVALPAGEGSDLLFEISEILGGPLGHALGGLLSLAKEGSDDDAELLAGLPEALEKLPRMIATKGGSKLLQRILKATKRQDSDGKWQVMGRADAFDPAYASNYLELFKAVGWVLQVNYAPFSQGSTFDWTALLSKLSQYLPISPMTSRPISEPEESELLK